MLIARFASLRKIVSMIFCKQLKLLIAEATTGGNARVSPMPEVPASHADLLERPVFAHLATVRPDRSPQSSVIWFAWDGSRIRLTHTSTRQKFANLAREPRVALSIADPMSTQEGSRPAPEPRTQVIA